MLFNRMGIFLLYLTAMSIFFSDWIVFKLNIGHRIITWIPDLCSFLLLFVIPCKGAHNNSFNISTKYIVILAIYTFHILISLLFNRVPSGVAFAALRIYFRFIPFFLLPAAISFREKDIKQFIFFMFMLGILQCPVTLYQRFISYAGGISGDPIGGTLGRNTSAVLTIYLICVAAFLIAHYLRESFGFIKFASLLMVTVIPTSLNETKSTFFFLPLILIIPYVFSPNDRTKFKKVVALLVLLSFFFLGWNAVYTAFQQNRWGYGMKTFITKPERVARYSSTRLLPIYQACKFISKDPIHFVFGVGPGNASGSFNTAMQGAYVTEEKDLGVTSSQITNLIWEVGFGGVLIISTLLGILFYDSITFSSNNEYFGIISLSMISVIAIFGLSFFYKLILEANVIIYPFSFLAGLLVCTDYTTPSKK